MEEREEVEEQEEVAAELWPLVYESNPKHNRRKPATGRHGSLCPPDADGQALLLASDLFGQKRYATDGTHAYCAQQHHPYRNVWHGYPVDWSEVPGLLKGAWVAAGKVDRRTLRRAMKRRER